MKVRGLGGQLEDCSLGYSELTLVGVVYEKMGVDAQRKDETCLDGERSDAYVVIYDRCIEK
jgi:hypothetical protein